MDGIISQETKDAVLSAADIVSVVSDYVQLENRGNQWWGCCPFHHEKTPSFSVTPDKNMYYCFGCHEGGDAIKFVMEMEKIRFPEALKLLARKFGVEVRYSNNFVPGAEKPDNSKELYIDLYNRVADMFHYGLVKTEAGKFALDYITKRGISMETIEKFKLGYSPADRQWLKKFLKSKNFSDEFLANSGLFSKKYPDIAFFSDRLMFPIFDRRGQAVAFGGRFLRGDPEKSPKYLNSGDLIQYKKGETLYAFNFAKNAIRENKKVIFCEGYMDCVAYHQCGINYAVAPLGTALTDDQIKLVRGFADTILLSFDSDGAGQAATQRAILMCRRQGLTVKIIRLHNAKDPAEIMVNFGAETLTNEVNNAILDSDYLLSFLSQKYQKDTPEGKSKFALEFFPYIDALQTDIQKESSLVLLGQTLNISLEAIKRDFNNREDVKKRTLNTPTESRAPVQDQVVVNAEFRAVLAVLSDTNQFELMQSRLTESDFENPSARTLFLILKECYRAGDLSFVSVLSHCEHDGIKQKITESVSKGEFSQYTAQSVADSIEWLEMQSLERKKKSILEQMGVLQSQLSLPANQELMTKLFEEKKRIDEKLNKKGLEYGSGVGS
ncbi:MAG: DNA primase [Treponema sp.]|uniref:DNA primase n=1 Tax=Treponema sp. TaxID=166 RepID=UPI001B1ECC43|nr:DNA primase [Treponema sp.]MBO6218861.1 DNA primase [Treponema sp.]MBQ8680616.1 DNA primase [Treponema sp.]